MQVADEGMRYLGRMAAGLQQAVRCTGAMIHDDDVVTDFEQITGTLPFQRRCRRTGAEQCNLQFLSPGMSLLIALLTAP